MVSECAMHREIERTSVAREMPNRQHHIAAPARHGPEGELPLERNQVDEHRRIASEHGDSTAARMSISRFTVAAHRLPPR